MSEAHDYVKERIAALEASRENINARIEELRMIKETFVTREDSVLPPPPVAKKRIGRPPKKTPVHEKYFKNISEGET